MDLQRMLVGRFVRNVIPTRRSGVQIRARFIAPWWKKCTVIKHATRHLSRGQNGRDVFSSPSKALSLIRDESHLAEISSAMAHRVESYLKIYSPFRNWYKSIVNYASSVFLSRLLILTSKVEQCFVREKNKESPIL